MYAKLKIETRVQTLLHIPKTIHTNPHYLETYNNTSFIFFTIFSTKLKKHNWHTILRIDTMKMLISFKSILSNLHL